MLELYIVCAVLGGGMMLLSALGGVFHGDIGGGHEVSLEADHQIDFDHDLATTDMASTDADHSGIDVAHDTEVGFGPADFYLAFMSARFMTYLIGIFGIMGLGLTLLSSLPALSVGLLSGGFALTLGYGGALLYRYLKVEGETSGVTNNDYVGAMGKILVGIKGPQPGKVRLSIKGDTLDMIALSEGEKDIAQGEEIVVVGLEGHHVRVAPKGDYLD